MKRVHHSFPAERITYDDPLTGRPVTQLTTIGNNAKAYFTAPHFVDGGRTLVFCSDRTGTWEVFKLDMADGRIVQLTDDANLTGVNSRISLCCHPHKPLAYVMAGRNERLLEIDVERGGAREMLRMPDGFKGDLIVVSANGSRLASTYIEDLHNVPNALMTRRPNEIYSGSFEYTYRRPSSVVFVVDTATGVAEAVWGEHEYLDHVQIVQTNPDLLVFCHGGSPAAQRMWLIDVPNIPGKQSRKLVPQDPLVEACCHEFACADGWIGFQYRRFHGGYRCNPEEFFAFVEPVTGQVERYRLPGPRPGHFQATADRRRAIADCDSPRGQVEDAKAPYFRAIARYELTDGKAIPTVLCRHDSSFKTHESHPHPVFTPDERHVVWASDRGGATHLYMCAFD